MRFDALANLRLTFLALFSATFVHLPISRFQISKGKVNLKNIYVGNLSFGATEDSVRALFETHGTVGRVNIVTDRDTGQPRGFGFVEMANDGEGEKAIAAVNGTELDGRALSVNEARPKTERAGGGGGGMGRKRW
jgi:cold-inducible RNA-binding protein